jgi:2-C-methyl-D-erythritol 4-phosphate cytidylyltransferase/2-C-methyl-D-erythritol 2,4-cyclodiphosphate synthase
MRAMLDHPGIDLVQVVIGGDDAQLYAGTMPDPHPRLMPPVTGGETRQSSVLRGLLALEAHAPDRVLIHDGARPFVAAEIISRVLQGLERGAGAIAALPIADAVKRSGDEGYIAASLDRSALWGAQTPQGFDFQAILRAHKAAAEAGLTQFADDAAVAEWAGLRVMLVTGSERNRKITTAEDLAMATMLIPQTPDIRTGHGFDVHKLVPGDHVWLCGVKIPHSHSLAGHSDADVGLHALTDALLGALGEGDIGQLFPDTDPQWRGAASHIFVREAVRRVRLRGAHIANADITVVCESPRIAPYRQAMRGGIAQMLEVETERISVKATTTETLGFTGRREGIAALATATVIVPPRPAA